MKKKEKYYAINNQEDEDGYSLYPGSVVINENLKKIQNINFYTTVLNNKSHFAKQRSWGLLLSNR
jgi:hypothetical protein